MYKVIGGATLTWPELSKVLLNVKTQINCCPLSYVEDDIELPTLTPSTFLFRRTNQLSEEEAWRIKDQDIWRHVNYLQVYEDKMWNRWRREYLTALRERHNPAHTVSKFHPELGDFVIMKADNKNCGTWPLTIVSQIYPGNDGVVRTVQLKDCQQYTSMTIDFIQSISGHKNTHY